MAYSSKVHDFHRRDLGEALQDKVVCSRKKTLKADGRRQDIFKTPTPRSRKMAPGLTICFRDQ
jgi:hypothetical protein